MGEPSSSLLRPSSSTSSIVAKALGVSSQNVRAATTKAILGKLYSYERYTDIDTAVVAKELGISVAQVGGVVGTALNNKEAWEEHKRSNNFTEDQRPAWVGIGKEAATALEAGEIAKAGQAAQAGASAVDAPGSRKSTIQAPIGGAVQLDARAVGNAGNAPNGTGNAPNNAGNDAPNGAPGAPGGAPGAAGNGAGNADQRALARVNAELGDSYHVETLGGNALRNWIRQNNLIEMNGGYWQNTMLPGGQQAMVRVQPPQRVIEADVESEAETAQLVYKNLDAAQLAILKKVLFHPESFTYFSWAKSKGHLGEDKDFGDFVNQCIKLTMTKIFGARVGVVVEWGSYFGCSLCRGAIRYQEGECS